MCSLGEWGWGVLVSEFFFKKESIFFGGGAGGGYFLTINPNLTKHLFFFLFFLGGGREGKCTCINKCFKWHFFSSRRTPVQNYFGIHAYM